MAFTPGNSKMQTYLFTQVDGVALAHSIPTVTRKTVAGNLEGEQRLGLKLELNKGKHAMAEPDGKHVVHHPSLHS